MMSKLIVEMNMPKDCYDCPMYDFASYRGKLTLCCNAHLDLKPIPNNGNPRPSWCPIVGELPEQHGRLIDEAVFCENVVKYSHQSTKTIGKALDATPTILDMTLIDAERSET